MIISIVLLVSILGCISPEPEKQGGEEPGKHVEEEVVERPTDEMVSSHETKMGFKCQPMEETVAIGEHIEILFKVKGEVDGNCEIYEKVVKGKEINKTRVQEYFKNILIEAKKAEPQRFDNLSRSVMYSFIEDNDNAIESLQKCFQSGNLYVSRMIQGPYFDNLHSDKRFVELIKKMKLDKYMKLQ